ncbi:MAG: diacylglycerol kinase family lipid kinase [Firmicutes bacterium]|nr:diacylglycerol kinase family lipid kinase [Bacillota bacterium]
MNKLLFIINPNSGKKDSKTKLLDAFVEFSNAGYTVEVFCTLKAGDCLNKCRDHGSEYDIVVVSGGDGTVNEATNGLMACVGKKPLLGYIPAGTMNDFSCNFGLTNSFKETSKKIMDGRTADFDVGSINGRYFNYVVGIGAFTNVSYDTDRELKSNIGDAAYILTALGEVVNLRPIQTKVTMDNDVFEGKISMLLIVNGYRVSGIDMVEKKEDLMNDGVFDIILVEWKENPIEFIASPILVMHPEWTNVSTVKRYKSSTIKVETEEFTEWTIDGEKGDKTKVAEIKNIPSALKILY